MDQFSIQRVNAEISIEFPSIFHSHQKFHFTTKYPKIMEISIKVETLAQPCISQYVAF